MSEQLEVDIEQLNSTINNIGELLYDISTKLDKDEEPLSDDNVSISNKSYSVDSNSLNNMLSTSNNFNDIITSMREVSEEDVESFSKKIVGITNSFDSVANFDMSSISSIDYDTLKKSMSSMVDAVNDLGRINTKKLDTLNSNSEAIRNVIDNVSMFSDNNDITTSVDNIKQSIYSIGTLTEPLEYFGKVSNDINKQSNKISGTVDMAIGNLQSFAERINDVPEITKDFSNISSTLSNLNTLGIDNFIDKYNSFNEDDIKQSISNINLVLNSINGDIKETTSAVDDTKTQVNLLQKLNDTFGDIDISNITGNVSTMIDSFSNIDKSDVKDTVRGINNIISSISKIDTKTSIDSQTKRLGDVVSSISSIDGVDLFENNFNNIISTFNNIDKSDITSLTRNLNLIERKLKDVNTESLKNSFGNISSAFEPFIDFDSSSVATNVNTLVESLGGIDKKTLNAANKNSKVLSEIIKNTNIFNELSKQERETKQEDSFNVNNELLSNETNKELSNKFDMLISKIDDSQKSVESYLNSILGCVADNVNNVQKETKQESNVNVTETEDKNTSSIDKENDMASVVYAVASGMQQMIQILNSIKSTMSSLHSPEKIYNV